MAGTDPAWAMVIDPSTARTRAACHGVELRPSCGTIAMDSLFCSVDAWIDNRIWSARFWAIEAANAFPRTIILFAVDSYTFFICDLVSFTS